MRLGLVKHVVVVKTIAVTTNLSCEVRRRLELLVGGLQIRFQHIAEYRSRSDCA